MKYFDCREVETPMIRFISYSKWTRETYGNTHLSASETRILFIFYVVS